jgi:hypothetical protein
MGKAHSDLEAFLGDDAVKVAHVDRARAVAVVASRARGCFRVLLRGEPAMLPELAAFGPLRTTQAARAWDWACHVARREGLPLLAGGAQVTRKSKKRARR